MTEQERNVPSREWCQKLKDSGLVQEGWMWYWNHTMYRIGEPESGVWTLSKYYDPEEDCAAPSLGVMGEWLPRCWTGKVFDSERFSCWLDDGTDECFAKADTEADARAAMLLELHNRNIIDIRKLRP